MTAEERAKNIEPAIHDTNRWDEHERIQYIAHAITEAVAEEREKIAKENDNRAKELSHPILGETNDQHWARVGRLEEARSVAAAIRKRVKL